MAQVISKNNIKNMAQVTSSGVRHRQTAARMENNMAQVISRTWHR